MEYTEFIIGGVTFLVFILIYLLMNQKASQQDIVEKAKIAGQQASRQSSTNINRPNKVEGYDASVSELFDVATGLGRSEYKTLFTQAGWNPKHAQRNAILTKIGLMLACVVPAILLVNTWSALINRSGFTKVLVVIGAGIFGILMFDKFMRFIINMRYDRISKDLHSAVELLVVCSKAGMGIEKGMERVAQEVSQYNPDLGREFMLTAIELEIMPNRRVAYENLRKRVNLPLVHGMTTTLIQAEEQGSSVSESLRILSDEFRTQLLMAFERKAAKLPATLSIPVVLFTLPTLMAVILGPAIIKLMKDTSVF